MLFQKVLVAIIVLGAIYYLFSYFSKQTKSHKCDDCGLMELKKESELKNKVTNN